jgi:hypothetical protein
MLAKMPQSARVRDWLAGIQQVPHQRGDSPLSLVLGPAGVGKTIALKHGFGQPSIDEEDMQFSRPWVSQTPRETGTPRCLTERTSSPIMHNR